MRLTVCESLCERLSMRRSVDVARDCFDPRLPLIETPLEENYLASLQCSERFESLIHCSCACVCVRVCSCCLSVVT